MIHTISYKFTIPWVLIDLNTFPVEYHFRFVFRDPDNPCGRPLFPMLQGKVFYLLIFLSIMRLLRNISVLFQGAMPSVVFCKNYKGIV